MFLVVKMFGFQLNGNDWWYGGSIFLLGFIVLVVKILGLAMIGGMVLVFFF